MNKILRLLPAAAGTAPARAQIGRRIPPQCKIAIDPVTNVPLTFLAGMPLGDSKIHQTRHQWTMDHLSVQSRPQTGFRAQRENRRDRQVTERAYMGALCLAHLSMKLQVMRNLGGFEPPPAARRPQIAGTAPAVRRWRPRGLCAIVKIDKPLGPKQMAPAPTV